MADENRTKVGEYLAQVTPAKWLVPSTREDCRQYADVEVQLTGAFTAYTPNRSLDGVNFVACPAYDKDGTAMATITTAGIYRLPGSGWLTLAGGAGATVWIRKGS